MHQVQKINLALSLFNLNFMVSLLKVFFQPDLAELPEQAPSCCIGVLQNIQLGQPPLLKERTLQIDIEV